MNLFIKLLGKKFDDVQYEALRFHGGNRNEISRCIKELNNNIN